MQSKESDGGAPFAKDFGYLGKFLLGVAAHARSLEGSRGDRLRVLMDGEVERWQEIEALLGGASPAPDGATVRRAGGSPAPRDGGPSAAEAAGASAYELTVGNLRTSGTGSEP